MSYSAEKHLYEFSEGGFYAAESREAAFKLYDADCGEALAAEDFARDVPDDEVIAVWGESPDDKWDDPRETREYRGLGGFHWVLRVTAREWANELTHGEGHVFGGDY